MAEFVVSLPDDEGLAEAIGSVEGVEFVTWNLDGPPPRVKRHRHAEQRDDEQQDQPVESLAAPAPLMT